MNKNALILLIGVFIVFNINIVYAQPHIYATYGDKPVYYDAEKRAIIVEITLCNDGDSMTEPWVFEAQAKRRTLSWLPVLSVLPQATCDPEHPENVHVKFLLAKGECNPIHIEIKQYDGYSTLPIGDYDIYFLTVNACCTEDPNCYAVEPFGWGRYFSTITVKSCEAKWICKDANTRAYQNLDCSLTNEEYCPYGCENGECLPAPPADIRIESITGDTKLKAGETATYVVRFKNYGGDGSINAELCIYPKFWLTERWAILATIYAPEVSKCCAGNDFCQARKITLKSGEVGDVVFSVKAPTPQTVDACAVKWSAWDTSGIFFADVGTYTQCGEKYKSEKRLQITIIPYDCGNGKCEVGETTSNCPQDCVTEPSCGDGQCNGDETCQTCPQDCGACDDPCQGISCPNKCENGVELSGGKCVNGECVYTSSNPCPSGKCADDICANDPQCPPCPASSDWTPCVNGIQYRHVYYCDATTNYQCALRIETQKCQYCGDKVCGTGENYENCPQDCPPEIPWTWIIIGGLAGVYILRKRGRI